MPHAEWREQLQPVSLTFWARPDILGQGQCQHLADDGMCPTTGCGRLWDVACDGMGKLQCIPSQFISLQCIPLESILLQCISLQCVSLQS